MDVVAEKLKNKLESVSPPLENSMGFHIAGFADFNGLKVPQLRHVFRTWHAPGKFTNKP